MPAMYPEELRRLREQNPGLQYDFRGRLIDDGGYGTGLEQQVFDQMYGPIDDQIRDAYYGPGNLLNGSLSQQWWDPNGELAQRGLSALMSEQDLPDVGFYSQWDPDTNSWVRHGSPSDGGGFGVSRSGDGLGASRSGARVADQTGDPWNLQGWTPYEPNFGTGKRDLWRGSPAQTETFPNDAYGQS